MKTFFGKLGIAVLFASAFALIGWYFLGRGGSDSESGSPAPTAGAETGDHSPAGVPPSPDETTAPRQAVTLAGGNPEEMAALRRELRSATGKLEKLENLARPLSREMYSSAVRAELGGTESLVQGGFWTDRGKCEFAFLKPRRVRNPDGEETVEVETRVLAVERDFVRDQGLDTLASPARNTLQHAEAWIDGEVDEVIGTARLHGTEPVNLPSVSVALSSQPQPFSVSLGDAENPTLTLQGTVKTSGESGFLIESRIERNDQPLLSLGAGGSL